MPKEKPGQRSHFLLVNTSTTERFESPSSGPRESTLPNLDRQIHGRALLAQIANLKTEANTSIQLQRNFGLDSGLGIQISFKSQPNVELAFESLSNEQQGIELLNIRHEGVHTFATVYVPEGKLQVFEKKIVDYLSDRRSSDGSRSLDHKALITTIQEIRTATFDALWTDDLTVIPEDETQAIWWEIWLPVRGNRDDVLTSFRSSANLMGFELSSRMIKFPERTVLHMKGSKLHIVQSIMLLNNIAEIRRAKETADCFDSLAPVEQSEWVENLLERTTYTKGNVPYACILDTGVNREHPLLNQAIDAADVHTNNPAWGTQDDQGHGSEMAGLTIFGDLIEPLASRMPLTINHRLESVKILHSNHSNEGEPYGDLTIEAVGRPEITAPNRRRVFSMAVTTKDYRDRGRPSAWSAVLDGLACDYWGEGLTPRLIVVSGGNVADPNAWRGYPDSNTTDGIHDPGQSWNALTVGAYTDKQTITEPGTEAFMPIAPKGGLSPFSTTSVTWQKRIWPYKPDVVFEGGNAAQDAAFATTMASLNLLTTNHKPFEKLLTTTNATSAATALCTRMSAQIMVQYPNLWPETIRALIVHSAEWTSQMRSQFLSSNPRKEDYANLIRHVGFGVPNLECALWSLSNSLTMVIQDSLQPFQKEHGKEPTAKDMHLHRLPWPTEALQELGSTEVEMRATLSYFIEPKPGITERGVKGKYRYESYGLRFEIKRPAENERDFRMRINGRARDEEEGNYSGGGSDPNWRVGPTLRNLGSLHSDLWTGTAAELAERGILAIYPALGWWKTAKKLGKYNKKARYAFIVSIKAPKTNVDLYNIIAQKIKTRTVIET